MCDNGKEQTTFGYRYVSTEEKTTLVQGVFDAVAHRYDLMNDLMSLGWHRIWKRVALMASEIRAGQQVLDIAAGTGDVSAQLARSVGRQGKVVCMDLNTRMLHLARDRLTDQGLIERISLIQADAEHLPFATHSFDCITIAFGLRNITKQHAALSEMYRVLKPGHRCLILEFSHLVLPILQRWYDKYSFIVIPRLGRWIANDESGYRYLVESIRMHPDQEQLKAIMLASGWDEVTYHNFSGGIVALHIGYKY